MKRRRAGRAQHTRTIAAHEALVRDLQYVGRTLAVTKPAGCEARGGGRSVWRTLDCGVFPQRERQSSWPQRAHRQLGSLLTGEPLVHGVALSAGSVKELGGTVF